MKRVLLFFILAVFVLTYSRASNVGHFSKDVSAQNVSVASFTHYLSEWFELPESTTFVLMQSQTDNGGIQHLNYQQLFRGNAVEGCRVIAHAKDGQVMYVNGVVLERPIAPAAPKRIVSKKQIRQISHASVVEDYILTPIFTGDSVVYKYAYRLPSAEEGYDVYYDAETGEVLKKISTRYGLTSVQGTANTYYEGTKSITCAYDSSLYHLIDPDRQIYTFNGSKTPASLLNYLFPSSVVDTIKSQLLDTLPVEIQNDERLYEFYLRNALMQSYMIPTAEQYVSAPTSATPSFSGTSITQVVIDSIGAAWQGEEAPEVFITIDDQNFVERYNNMADRVTFGTLPVTFTLDVPVWADSYYLYVWAYSDTADVLLAVFPLGQEEGTFGYGSTIGAHAVVTQTAGAPSPILDAHWGIQHTFDFYSNVFGRNSFDGLGSPIYQFVNVSGEVIENGNNAFASFTPGESAYMMYGMGDGDSYNPLVDLTIAAHEYSHLITYFNSSGGLKYQNESGALNEGFSDLFAMCVENYVEGAPSWLIAHKGAVIGKSNMRSMSDPYQNEDGDYPCPKAYLGRYWIPSTSNPDSNTNDHGGVHSNSSVLNYWFYVLCEGGTFTNEFNRTFSVQGIGIEKAQVIAYLINQYYLTEYATYYDAYRASLIIANLIYGQGSQEYQSVQNAWGVVGIGNGYRSRSLPFLETFASDRGEFIIENVELDGLDHVWAFAPGYGMKASAYVSGVSHTTESWLISPCLLLPADSAISLTFDHVYRYTSTPALDLTLLVSEDYLGGTPYSATWTPMAIPVYSSGSNWTFVNTGNIRLDAYAGKHISLAFRYRSSTADAATWEIKNVSVTSSPLNTGVDNVINLHNATKCLIDGHLFILRNGHLFSVTGMTME